MSTVPEPATTSLPPAPSSPAEESPAVDPALRPDESASEERRRERYRL
jgi:hypothetical protein